MKSIILTISVWLIFGTSAICGTIQWNMFSYLPHVYVENDSSVNSGIVGVVHYYEYDSIASIYLNTVLNKSAGYAILEASTSTYLAAWGGYWREFAEGEVVQYDTIFGSFNDYFFVSDSGGARSDRTIIIPVGESIYLGFSSVSYGWVQIGYDGDSVYIINSAVDIDGDPIQVGWIPEPGVGVLALAACVVLLLRRGGRRSLTASRQ